MNKITRYVPENSIAIERDGLPAIVYSYTNRNGQLAAIAYRGKSGKNVWHYRFSKETDRAKRIDEFFTNTAEREEYKNKSKAAKKEFRHTLKIGDFLNSSWGYEQTNVEFYQIVSVTEKTVTFREVAQTRERTSHDSGVCAPIRDAFIESGKTFTRPVKQCGNDDTKGMVKLAEYKGDYMKCLWFFDSKNHYFSDGY